MTADQLIEMLQLSESSDSVELKLTVPDADRRATVQALEIDPLGARLRQIVFFDTPDLALNRPRPRRPGPPDPGQGRRLRRQASPGGARRAPEQAAEGGRLQGRGRCHARRVRVLRRRTRAPSVRTRSSRCSPVDKPIRTLFSKPQRAFFAEHAPDGIDARRPGRARTDHDDEAEVPARRVQPRHGRRAVAVPRRIAHRGALDQVHPHGGRRRRRRVEGVPHSRGVDLGGEQQTKTKTALEFFVKEPGGRAPSGPRTPPCGGGSASVPSSWCRTSW